MKKHVITRIGYSYYLLVGNVPYNTLQVEISLNLSLVVRLSLILYGHAYATIFIRGKNIEIYGHYFF